MDAIRFYNSLTKQVEPFTSADPGKVRIYNCGPTVYKRQHIGNMRRFLFSDTLRRTLELFGYEVRDITNLTDVGHLTQDDLDAGEDKLEKEAREKETTPQAIAEEQTRLFHVDLQALNIEPAHLYPKATAHIEEMQALIAQLLERGHAYQTNTGVYFDITSFPAYGQLSGNTLEHIEAGSRIEIRTEKKHPADFALWIFDTQQAQLWDSPWGRGYPGWHIECSAMSLKYLDSGIDIHTGGEDNKFPHHENEIAQSEGATGKPFVRLWMHNSHLLMKGAKLAKREGQQITLDTVRDEGFSPLAFRLLVLGSHYRTKMEFSWEALSAAAENLATVKQLVRRLKEMMINADTDAPADQQTLDAFRAPLADDLNTPQALAAFLQYIKASNALLDQSPTPQQLGTTQATLTAMDQVIGVIGPLEAEIEAETIPAGILELAQQREQARENKQFEKADELRIEIERKGYKLEDTPSGPRVLKLS